MSLILRMLVSNKMHSVLVLRLYTQASSDYPGTQNYVVNNCRRPGFFAVYFAE